MSTSSSTTTSDVASCRGDTIPRRHPSVASSNGTNESSSNSSITSTKSSVTFGTAHVREYERVLEGRLDIPMSLNIGWAYTDQPTMSIDEFDHICRQDRIFTTSTRSMQIEQTSLQERFALLHYVHGFSIQELEDSEIMRLRQLEDQQQIAAAAATTTTTSVKPTTKKNGRMFRKLFKKKGSKSNIVLAVDVDMSSDEDDIL